MRTDILGLTLVLLAGCGGNGTRGKKSLELNENDPCVFDAGAPAGCLPNGDYRSHCVALSDTAVAPSEFLGLRRDPNGGIVLDPTSMLVEGNDESGNYNSSRYAFAEWTSGVLTPGILFDAAVPSWNADTPEGTFLQLEVQARINAEWTAWLPVAVWSTSAKTVTSHSFTVSDGKDATFDTSTLLLAHPAEALRLRARLYIEREPTPLGVPSLRRLAVSVARRGKRGPDVATHSINANLDVPAISQMEQEGTSRWCAPTSSMMLYSYTCESADSFCPDAMDENSQITKNAAMGYDVNFNGYGNWALNLATITGQAPAVEGEIVWLDSLADVELYIAAGIPLALSVSWNEGELSNAPITETPGHILVVRGFDSKGDVLVNDPAAYESGQVDRVYKRKELERAWLNHSQGVAYLVARKAACAASLATQWSTNPEFLPVTEVITDPAFELSHEPEPSGTKIGGAGGAPAAGASGSDGGNGPMDTTRGAGGGTASAPSQNGSSDADSPPSNESPKDVTPGNDASVVPPADVTSNDNDAAPPVLIAANPAAESPSDSGCSLHPSTSERSWMMGLVLGLAVRRRRRPATRSDTH